MTIPDELKKWVQQLTTAEKRFIKLQGKIRSGSDSQLIGLFDYLNQNPDADALPAKSALARNLPTLTTRLRSLVLDSLYLLHKDDNTEMQLSSMLTEIALLQSKNLQPAAARQLKRAKKLAYDYCRYTYVLLFLEAEQQAALKLPVNQLEERLQELRDEELQVMERQRRLRELQQVHNQLLLLAKQFPFSREPGVLQQIRSLADVPLVQQAYENEPFLEHALAVNIFGIRDLFLRDPDSAVPRYQQLIRRWQQQPGWVLDQTQLLLAVCKYYQNVCIFSPVDYTHINADLAFLHGFGKLPESLRLALQDVLYGHQLAITLNMARFDVLSTVIPEIETWLEHEAQQLTESQVLPYRCNILVAEFMAGNFAAAHRQVNKLLALHSRKDRMDIYEFGLIMRAVLQFELEDDSLNEYIIRSGKRHFSRNKIAADFELMVLQHLARLHELTDSRERRAGFGKLREAVDAFAETLPPTIPLLGLNEIRWWAEAGETGVPLKSIFIDRINANLRMLEGVEKLG